MPITSNDNAALAGPDSHGQAAILLVESLVHGLIEQDVITLAHAIEIVDHAADVAGDLNDGEGMESGPQSLLNAISVSLSRDLKRD